jgi:hypothetical protein
VRKSPGEEKGDGALTSCPPLPSAEGDLSTFADPDIQQLMRDLRDQGVDCPISERDGVLSCPAFDPITATLAITLLAVRQELPASFGRIRRILGDMRIQGEALRGFRGFEQLEHVSGTLAIVDCPQLTSLGGFSALAEVGSLGIERNPVLAAVSGFTALRRVKDLLRLSHCAELAVVDGLSGLAEVGKLELTELPSLTSIGFLQGLVAATDILVNRCPITDASPLRTVVKTMGKIRHGIRIVGTLITDVEFLASLRSVGSSLYLNANRIERLNGLEDLETVGASLNLAGNCIADLTPLRRLRQVGGILSLTGNRLTSLAGLENLRSLRTRTWSGQPRTLRLCGNPELRDISALASVEERDHYLLMDIDQDQHFAVKPPVDSVFHDNILALRDAGSGRIFPTCDFVAKPSHDYGRFRAAMANAALSCLVDFERAADTLVIVFTGTSNAACWLVIDGLNAHKVLLADPSGRWYHGGVPGLSRDLDGTVSFLRGLTADRRYRTVVCVGAAAGGTMAILAGWPIGADHVIALAPQTCLDPTVLEHWGDRRFGHVPPGMTDLRQVLAEAPPQRTRLWVSCSPADAPDVAHLNHLPDRPELTRSAYQIYDRLVGDGVPADEALNAEVFLALGLALDTRYELIGGLACPLRPDTPDRIALTTNIAAWLFNHFRAGPFRVHMGRQKLFVRAAGAFLFPDLFASSAQAPAGAGDVVEQAVLALDVLDGVGEAFERGRRFDLFQAIPSLREYVTIDVHSRAVRTWRRSGDWLLEARATPDLALRSLGVTVPASMVFANLS